MAVDSIEVTVVVSRLTHEMSVNPTLRSMQQNCARAVSQGHLNTYEDLFRDYVRERVNVMARLIQLFIKQRNWEPEFVAAIIECLAARNLENIEFKALYGRQLF